MAMPRDGTPPGAGYGIRPMLLGAIAALLVLHTIARAEDAAKPLQFLGNQNLAPVVYVQDGRAAGLAVDLVRALEPSVGRRITVTGMDWAMAQERVARGEADALVQINFTEERTKVYDFSKPLLQSQFSIFTQSTRPGITGISSLRGLKVGVEQKGLPQQLLKDNSFIQLEIIPSFLAGFRRLQEGDLDAVVVDYRVGAYVLAENGISNIKVSGEPIAYSESAIAVKKGNSELLAAIDKGLDTIRKDGTYARIVSKWEPKEVIFLTQEQISRQRLLLVISALLFLCVMAAIWIATIYRELRKRRLAENRWQLVFENSPVSLWEEDFSEVKRLLDELRQEGVTDLDEHFAKHPEVLRRCAALVKIVAVNEASQALHGAASKEGLLAHLVNTFTPEAFETFRKELVALWEGKMKMTSETIVKTFAGECRNVTVQFAVCPGYQKTLSRVLVALVDTTERSRSEEKLRLSASVFSHAHEGIVITAPDATILDVNEAFTRITGFSRNEVLGKTPRVLNSGRHDKEFFKALWHDLIEKGHWYGEIWNRRKKGDLYAEMLNISAVRNGRGEVLHYLGLFSDITALKAQQQQLEHLAHYDALTALPNRVLLADRLNQAMAQAQRRASYLAVAYLDLDGFKEVNDEHGHATGDQILVAIANRLSDTLREGDTLARIGGDEFVVVMLDTSSAKNCVPTLDRLLHAVTRSIVIGPNAHQISASLGVTFYPQQDEVDADQLLRQADQAMYQAKLAGKNRYHFFDEKQDRSVRGHHESLERIRRALANDEFVLYYQPKVNMRTGEIIGTEALIRWQHPDKGLLAPAVFLPVIETHTLAIDLGERVLHAAMTQLEAWQDAGLDIPISVNVSAFQLQQSDFVVRMRSTLDAHPRVGRGKLMLEVLETSALQDLAHVSQVITECRAMGVSFALDDFGTGYSSLTYLKRLPVYKLKIDQSFVRDMLDDPDDLAILQGTIGLASAFGRKVIAEGVETVEHGELLLQLGCELGQGYGIARPMPAADIPPWVATWHPSPSWSTLRPVRQEDLPLLFGPTEHRAWLAALRAYLKGETDRPQTLDHTKSRFGRWLYSEGQTHPAMSDSLPAIETLHRQLHTLGADLCGRQRSDEDVAQGLGEIAGLCEALINAEKTLLAKRCSDRPN